MRQAQQMPGESKKSLTWDTGAAMCTGDGGSKVGTEIRGTKRHTGIEKKKGLGLQASDNAIK